MQRTALIIGATGLVGHALLTQLGSLYQKVIIIARSQPKGLSDSMHFYQLKDFNQLYAFICGLPIGKDTDAFSCLGSTIKEAGGEAAFRQVDFTFNVEFAKACQEKGVERFFLLSAMGANPDSRFFYNRVKGELETAISQLGFQELAIFRPSLLLGKHDDRKLETIAQTAYQLLKPIIPKKLPVRPIEADRVAMAMALVSNNYHIQHTYEKNANRLDCAKRTQIISNSEMLAMTRFRN